MDINELKPNSHKSKQDVKKEIRPVVNQPAKVVKKSLFKKMSETFIGNDIVDVRDYLIEDVIIPTFKDLIADVVKGGIETLLFGESSGRGSRRNSGGKSNVSYYKYYDDKKGGSSKRSQTRSRSRKYCDDILVSTRGEAEDVRDQIHELMSEYGQVSVAAVYEMVNIPDHYTDHHYGWTDISSLTISRCRDGGWLINLPPIESLD